VVLIIKNFVLNISALTQAPHSGQPGSLRPKRSKCNLCIGDDIFIHDAALDAASATNGNPIAKPCSRYPGGGMVFLCYCTIYHWQEAKWELIKNLKTMRTLKLLIKFCTLYITSK
jgi:hypothetical protein